VKDAADPCDGFLHGFAVDEVGSDQLDLPAPGSTTGHQKQSGSQVIRV
jgi:hypothetical protein